MKARPRSVEREVAAYLSQIFSDAGITDPTVVRIPVLGRTGPDISYDNSVKLIVDVKSRKAVPLSALAPSGAFKDLNGGLMSVRLEDLRKPNLKCWYDNGIQLVVRRWYDHMNKWTQANVLGGISAIILHKPRMPIGHSSLVIKSSDWRELCLRMNCK